MFLRVSAARQQLKVAKTVVTLVLVLVMNEEPFRNHLPCVLPPNELMLVHILAAITLARVPLGSDHELVKPVLHGSRLHHEGGLKLAPGAGFEPTHRLFNRQLPYRLATLE